MAIVHVSLYAVCGILTVFYKSAALKNIDRTLCLETIIKFIHDQHQCNFVYNYADEHLKDDHIACQTRCNVTIANISSASNLLSTIDIKFGNEAYKYFPCTSHYFVQSLYMNVICQGRNNVKIPVGGYCALDEQCDNLGVCKLGRCMCGTGYILHNLKCHNGNIPLNQPCSFSEQCAGAPYVICLERKCSCIVGYTAENSPDCVQIQVPVGGYCNQGDICQGSENSGVCSNGICVCRTGYISFNLECYEENLALNQSCSFSEQCKGSPYASCLGGKCSCIEGYTAGESNHCVQTKVPVGGYCKQNEQCKVSEDSGECVQGRCVCRAGYVLSNLECHEGNLALNQLCSFSEQCTGSPYASCLGGKCSCIEGYTAEDSNHCVQIKVPVGGYCTQNDQCQGSANSGVCDHKRCVCKPEYVLFNLECYEGNLALNQSCSFSEQCKGSPNASCLGGKCSCNQGYTAEESSHCVQSQKITLPSSLQHHQEEVKIGTTLGALFGGLLLGVVLTTVVVVIIYRRSKTHVNKREEPIVTFADNNRYSLAKIVDHGTFKNIQTKDKKREVSPYACSKETWIYDNVYSKPRNRQTQEAVYNHLHEQVKQDDEDYYDHACAASAHIGDMDDYSHVQHTTS